jgi:hypothetical protein
MAESVFVLYKGFQTGKLTRDYTFTVREAGEEPRAFTLSIPNEAFNARRVRFQDAPDICSRRLIVELNSSANHPASDHFCVSDAEMANYRSSHPTKPSHRFPSHKRSAEA